MIFLPTLRRYGFNVQVAPLFIDQITINLTGRCTGLEVRCDTSWGALHSAEIFDNVGTSLGFLVDSPTIALIGVGAGLLAQGMILSQSIELGAIPRLIDGKKVHHVILTVQNYDPVNNSIFGFIYGED